MKKRAILRFLPLIIFIAAIMLLTSCTESYVVTFDTDDGSAVESVEVKEGDFISPPVTQKEGYAFDGWYYNNDKWDFEHYRITKNITLKAKWIKKHTVSFDTGEGGTTVNSQTVLDGKTVAKPANPTKEKAEFDGWYIGETKWNFEKSVVTKDLTLTARWKKLHTVSFVTSSDETPNSQQLIKDREKATKPQNPTKFGCVFDGWYIGSEPFDFNSEINGDVVITAKWKSYYTVTFDSNGLGAIDPERLLEDSLIAEPKNISRNEYDLLGWFNGDEKWDFTKDTVSSNVNLVAKWAKKPLVSFDSQGGTAVSAVYVSNGSKLTAPPSPEKELHKFGGWVTESGAPWDFNTPITSNITLYAKWDIDYFTVIFDIDGVKTSINVKQYTTIPEQTKPDKENYAFDGWRISGTEVKWDFSSALQNNITLEATWTQTYFTVTYDNAGTITTEKTPVTIPYAVGFTPQREGFAFYGWYYGSTRWDFEAMPVTCDMTLTALWFEVFTVEFNSNGGSAVASQKVVNGVATEPQAPFNSGCRFNGWVTENGTPWDFNTLITSDTKLYATWVEQRKVNFDANGGVLASGTNPTQYVDLGTLAIKPQDPTKTDYIFKGWYLGEVEWNFASDKVNEEITLVAKWEIKTFKVSFDTDGGAGSFNSQTVVAPDYILTEPTAKPTKEGSTFEGWYFGDVKWNFANSVTNNMVLVAKWKPITFTVTFDSNGAAPVASQTVVYGGLITRPDNPYISQVYEFNSWRDENGQIWDFANDTVDRNITLKAYYTVYGSEPGGGVIGPGENVGPMDTFD